MIGAALLLALAQPSDFPDFPLVAFASESVEERLAELGYSPAAVKVLREPPVPAGFVFTDEVAELFRLRDEMAKGTIPAAQLQQAEEAYKRKQDLDWARHDHEILRRLRGRDRLLYLDQMRWLAAPPPLLHAAPPVVAYTPEQIADFEKSWLERAARDDAQLRRLSAQDRLDFLIRLRASPR